MSTNIIKLDTAIQQAFQELKNEFKLTPGGKEGGWHQFLGNPKIGNVATSQALLLYNKFSIECPEKEKSINFLLHSQIASTLKHNDGGWPFISTIPGIANTESTSWALQALSNEFKITYEPIQKGIEWLKLNFFLDSKFSGWGPTQLCGFRIYSTCLVLNTLNRLEAGNILECQIALDSLKRAQNSDGGWGETPDTKSTLTHTAHSAITLMNFGIPPSSRAIELAMNWISTTLEAKTYENAFHMGYSEMFDLIYSKEQGTNFQRTIFYHMPLPYAILALIQGGNKNSKLIYQTILNLVKANDIGIWWHPLLLQKPLWAIYDVLNLLKYFKESSLFQKFNDFVPKNETKKKYDVIIFTVVPIEFLTLNKCLNFAPKGKKEDYSQNGYWYYEYTLQRSSGRALSCLITMIGSAGDVGCYGACSTTFEEFNCDLAILCGIAAGNKEDISKYSAIIAESVVAYEYQRLEEDKIEYRPKYYSVEGHIKRLIEKRDFDLEEWMKLVQDYMGNCGIDLKTVKDYKIEDTQLKAGVIASGAKLIANGKTLEVLKEKIPIEKGIIAADMEGSGFAPCCKEYNKEWLVIRGISDYGEDDKDDPINKKQQPLAVAAATATLVYYLKYIHRILDERTS